MISRSLVHGVCASLLVAAAPLRADYLDEIGYRALVAALQAQGKPVPNGAGVTISQVEAPETQGGSNYLPNAASFPGVTITNASASAFPSATNSGHATAVGQYLYGDSGMASGVTNVSAYNANHWIGSGGLNYSTSPFSVTAPRVEANDVSNHSWVGTTGSASGDRVILDRLDYGIERGDYVAVVGVNNGPADQNLLASAYNVISVGRSDGNHASGSSANVNTAVTYPHLVAPLGVTSYATPTVGAAAALLVETARSSAATSANGAKSEVVKAVLLAGATKDEFATWTRSDSAPLDAIRGAGELNVQNSYGILTAGEQPVGGTVAATGWDYGTLALGAVASYMFDLSSTADVSVTLTWNAIYTGMNFNSLSLSLADMSLFLYRLGPGGSLDLVQQSLASGNVEALWTTDVAAGSYVLKVAYSANASGSLSNVNYAVAWKSTQMQTAPVPEPGWTAVAVVGGLGIVIVARRRRRLTSAGA